jgi:hypothetical protein
MMYERRVMEGRVKRTGGYLMVRTGNEQRVGGLYYVGELVSSLDEGKHIRITVEIELTVDGKESTA